MGLTLDRTIDSSDIESIGENCQGLESFIATLDAVGDTQEPVACYGSKTTVYADHLRSSHR